jgi:non-ribosomal peptide synthetase component F
MTLLASWQVLLRWYSGQDDIVVGADIANRNWPHSENLIGFFINQLVLRTDLTGNPTLRELLARVREVTLGAYAHQDMPFDKIVEALNPERTTSRTPLFQAKIVLDNFPQEAVSLPGLVLSPLGLDCEAAKFDLTLTAWEGSGKLRLQIGYDADRFYQATITQMLAHLEALARAIVYQPDARLSELLEMLDNADEQHRKKRESDLREVSLNKLNLLRRRSVKPIEV